MKREIEIEERPFRERKKKKAHLGGEKKKHLSRISRGKFAFRLVPTASGGIYW